MTRQERRAFYTPAIARVRAGEPMCDVAASIGVSYASLNAQCHFAGIWQGLAGRFRAHGPWRKPHPGFVVPNERWASVDWTQTNVAIARALGCSRDNVWRKRKRLIRAGMISPRTATP